MNLSAILPNWGLRAPVQAEPVQSALDTAQAEWIAAKAAFFARKASGDTRGMGEAIHRLTRANCAVLRAERDAGRAS
jgi:hypothetical protein